MIAEHFRQGQINLQVDPLQIHQRHSHGRIFKGGPKTRLAVSERLLRTLSLRNILDAALVVLHLPGAVSEYS